MITQLEEKTIKKSKPDRGMVILDEQDEKTVGSILNTQLSPEDQKVAKSAIDWILIMTAFGVHPTTALQTWTRRYAAPGDVPNEY